MTRPTKTLIVIATLATIVGCTNTKPNSTLTSASVPAETVQHGAADGSDTAAAPEGSGTAAATEGAMEGSGTTAAPVSVGKFTPTMLANGEASHITVQHVLIGFAGSVPGKEITRSKEEAAALAAEILAKAQAGGDFGQLVRDHTDDSPPGIYHMANSGQPNDMNAARQEDVVYSRDGMVPAFGNTGFPLSVSQVGMASFDATNSPYGWHIVKRIK